MSRPHTPPKPNRRPSVQGRKSIGKPGAADQLIAERIEEAQKSLWWAELTRSLLALVVATFAAVILWAIVDQWIYSPSKSVRAVTLLAFVLGAGAWLYFRVLPLLSHGVRPEYAARALERNFPELRQSLTSYVTLRDEQKTDGLQGRVVRSLGSSTATFLQSNNQLPSEATNTLKQWMATAAALSVLIAYIALSPKNTVQSVRRLVTPVANITPATRVQIVEVTPGDTEALAGRSVQIHARVMGLSSDEIVSCRTDSGVNAGTLPLTQKPDSVDRFECVLSIPDSKLGKLQYWIDAGDASAGPFVIDVKNVPVVTVESIAQTPPQYTGIAPFTRTQPGIKAVDGTRVVLKAKTNRPVKRATIEFNPKRIGSSVQATDGVREMQIGEGGTSLSVPFALMLDQRRAASIRRDSYRIRIWDDREVTNPDPIVFPIEIVPDLAPEVTIVLPSQSPQQVPINAQQIIEVHASDPDYGLSRIEIQISRGVTRQEPITIWNDSVGKKGNQIAEFRFRPQELGLRVGQTAQVTAIATDNRVAVDQSGGNANQNANRVTTDPVELVIIESETLPPSQSPDEEGLSEPDDQPAASGEDQSDQSGESGGASGQQQGSGGSGEGSESAEGEGQEGSKGGGSGSSSGENSDGNEGESSNDGGGAQGSESSDSQSSGGNEMESPRSGAPKEGGSQAEEGTQKGDESSEGGSGAPGSSGQGERGGADHSPADEGMEPPDSKSNGAAGSSESATGNNTEGRSNNESGSSTPENAGSADQAPGEGDEPKDSTSGSGSSGDSGQQNGDASTSQQPGKPSQPPPSHDGEAFDRIREYLDQKQQTQDNSEGSGEGTSDDSTKPDQDSDSSQGSSGQNASGDDASSGQSEGGQSEVGQSEAGESGDSAGERPTDTGKPKTSDAGSADSGNSGQSNNDPASQQQESSVDSNGEQEGTGGQEGGGQEGGGRDGGSDQGKSSDQNQSGDQEMGSEQNNTGDQNAGDQGTGDQAAGNQNSGDSNASEQDSGSQSSAEPPSGDQNSISSSADDPSTKGRTGGQPESHQSTPTGPGTGEGVGGDGEGEASGGDQADAANDDYARQATDMVLDYLEQTRDQPDADLLDQLGWTAEELKKFEQRWNGLRELDAVDQSNPGKRQDMTEALRSLGLRNKNTKSTQMQTGRNDSLRNLRDSGNRPKPPAAYRDLFDAFRQQMNRSK